MWHAQIVVIFSILNFFGLNSAFADDPYTTIKQNSTAPADVKQKAFNTERAKQLNQILTDGKTTNPPVKDSKKYKALSDDEKQKIMKSEAADASKEDTDEGPGQPSGEVVAKKGPKARESAPDPAQTPIQVKQEKPLDELVFPGK